MSKEVKDIIAELENNKLEIEKKKKEKISKEANLIELYSERTIIIFSLLFSSIAGAILFSGNLKRLKKEGGDNVIFFGILYTIGIIIITSLIPDSSLRYVSYLLNILGGFIITIHFGSKLYPENLEYKNRKPWKAFIIALLIVLGIGFIYIKAKAL